MSTATADAGSAALTDQPEARRLRRSGYITAWLLIPADGEDQPAAAARLAGRRDRFAQP